MEIGAWLEAVEKVFIDEVEKCVITVLVLLVVARTLRSESIQHSIGRFVCNVSLSQFC